MGKISPEFRISCRAIAVMKRPGWPVCIARNFRFSVNWSESQNIKVGSAIVSLPHTHTHVHISEAKHKLLSSFNSIESNPSAQTVVVPRKPSAPATLCDALNSLKLSRRYLFFFLPFFRSFFFTWQTRGKKSEKTSSNVTWQKPKSFYYKVIFWNETWQLFFFLSWLFDLKTKRNERKKKRIYAIIYMCESCDARIEPHPSRFRGIDNRIDNHSHLPVLFAFAYLMNGRPAFVFC